MQVQHMITAGAGVAGYVASKKYGNKLPGGNVGKIAVGAGIAILGPMALPDSIKGPVAGFGVGVLADGLLSYVGL